MRTDKRSCWQNSAHSGCQFTAARSGPRMHLTARQPKNSQCTPAKVCWPSKCKPHRYSHSPKRGRRKSVSWLTSPMPSITPESHSTKALTRRMSGFFRQYVGPVCVVRDDGAHQHQAVCTLERWLHEGTRMALREVL